jgi:single-strand DNA-binding protein
MDVTFAGNLCADPELRDTKRGLVTEVRVAVNRNLQTGDDEWRQETSFYTVVAWRGLAERIAECLRKGDRVVVVGRMRQETWTTETGQPHSRYVVTAEEMAASVRFEPVHIERTESVGAEP